MYFTLNNESANTDDIAPDTSLLDYLREKQNLTGTKEGCASGDCGACTVLVGTEVQGVIQYKAVNSCIYPVKSLSNQYVVTVEKLQEVTQCGSDLTSVQQEMLECHGSQCGFCTPGFVMSLTALELEKNTISTPNDQPIREQVLDAISGNLCRCTGYRPIVEAGCNALKKDNQTFKIVQPPSKKAQNSALNEYVTASTNLASFFARPITEQDLQAWLLLYPQAQLIAGGTDLMLAVTQQYQTMPQLIDLTHIDSLQTINETDSYFEIGAAVSYQQLEKFAKQHAPVLYQQLLHRLGSRQIRNRGTIGGNICNASPIGDMPPYLLALNAEIEIINNQGDSRRMPITEFYLDYKKTQLQRGDYLAKVYISKAALAQPIEIFKLSKRYEDDISSVLGIFTLTQDKSLQIAFGGMAAIPKRAAETEAFLAKHSWISGSDIEHKIIDQACEILAKEFSPMTDVRASSDYRMAASQNLLRKACLAFSQPSAQLGVFHHA
ncbi:xanthine dehydrogenase small subunit [Paraglaciecola aquimarina]|uniref:Xanthine dehydrogenase small subunit n=1 Tax=Paraglaciecola algarum TaxID=3050085 RepID=A0ABS9D7N0_9ALTE|nr:xanthine dehydrogenase small subunit [Paraglaciecola sp. G1-23]MCF2948709.1 xanthine dehydrogenase small subunit [Paraglaciecola sp. G1-23]